MLVHAVISYFRAVCTHTSIYLPIGTIHQSIIHTSIYSAIQAYVHQKDTENDNHKLPTFSSLNILYIDSPKSASNRKKKFEKSKPRKKKRFPSVSKDCDWPLNSCPTNPKQQWKCQSSIKEILLTRFKMANSQCFSWPGLEFTIF